MRWSWLSLDKNPRQKRSRDMLQRLRSGKESSESSPSSHHTYHEGPRKLRISWPIQLDIGEKIELSIALLFFWGLVLYMAYSFKI